MRYPSYVYICSWMLLCAAVVCTPRPPSTLTTWNDLPVHKLRAACEERGLDCRSASRAEIVARLQAWQGQGSSDVESVLPTLNAKDAFALGIQMSNAGRMADSVAAFGRVVQIQPQNPEAWANLGLGHALLGRFIPAKNALEKCVSFNPGLEAGWVNLANVLNELKAPALRVYQTAVRMAPSNIDANANFAGALNKDHDTERCARIARQTLRLARGNAAAVPEALCALGNCNPHNAEWNDRMLNWDILMNMTEHDLQRGALPCFRPGSIVFHCGARQGAHRLIKRVAAAYSDSTALAGAEDAKRLKLNWPLKVLNGRIRISYLGADWGVHPMSFMMQGVFRNHDRSRVDVFCHATKMSDRSEQWDLSRRNCQNFVVLDDHSDVEVAERINRDKIHVVVVLYGYLRDDRNGIAARRPAPVAVNHRWCSTTGASYIDFHVGDTITLKPELVDGYSEKLTMLPVSYLVNDHAFSYGPAPPATPPPFPCVMSSLNNFYKISQKMFSRWMRVMKKYEGSTLWLIKRMGEVNPIRRMQAQAAKHEVDPQRVLAVSYLSKYEHVRRNVNSTVFVDTENVNAHSTAVDSLWAGVPVLTTPREGMCGRVAASLLHHAGTPHLLARSDEDYEQLLELIAGNYRAAKLVRDATISARGSDLFDNKLYVRMVERSYRLLWDLHHSRNQHHVITTHSNGIY